MKALKALWDLLVFLTPHVYTDEAVFDVDDKGEWYPVCSVEDVQPGEYFKKVGKVRAFQWLWFGFVFQRDETLREFNVRGRRGNSD